jgi:hypothetical protein
VAAGPIFLTFIRIWGAGSSGTENSIRPCKLSPLEIGRFACALCRVDAMIMIDNSEAPVAINYET